MHREASEQFQARYADSPYHRVQDGADTYSFLRDELGTRFRMK